MKTLVPSAPNSSAAPAGGGGCARAKLERLLRYATAAILFLGAPALGQKADWAPKVPEALESPLPGDPMRTTIHRLSNGLTVYLSPNHQLPRIAAWIAVRAGSKHDPADNTGQAHYLEHMLFKGSSALGTLDYEKEGPHLDKILALYEKRFKTGNPQERSAIYKEIDAENIQAARYEIPNEISKIYRQMGFKGLNAFTSNEETVYVCDMPSSRAEAWAKVESERFERPVFRLFQSELETVYEEKNRTLDNAEEILYEAANRRLYKVHPYGQQTTIGEIAHLKNPSLAKMYAFYNAHYLPNNMAIALSGDFDRKRMLELLEKYFSAWKPKPLPQPKTWPLPKPKGAERLEVRYEAEEKVAVAWPAVPLRHPDADALTVMNLVMDNAVAGIMNLALNQAQRVKASGSAVSFYNDAGDWAVWAVPKLGQKLEEAEGLLMEAVERLKKGEFTNEDIRGVITNYEVGEKARLESNASRVSLMAESFIHFEPWEETVGRLSRLRRVSREDVLRVAGKYLTDDRVIVYRRNGKPEIPGITKPEFTKIDIDPSRQSKFAAEVLALPAAPPEPRWLAEGRDYKVAPLASGKLISVSNPFNDLFTLSFSFERGRRHERDLCAALGLLDLSGAGTLTAEEYKKRLFYLGTSINYSCDEQDSGVSISGLNENLWPSLEMMLARFEAPNIATDTLKKMVEVAIGAHQDNKKDPEYVFHALGEFAGRGQDSAVLAELGDQELRSLKAESLRKLIREIPSYKGRAAYVGNRLPGEIAKLLESPRRYKDPPPHVPLRFLKPTRTKVYFANRDMVQSQVGLVAADEILDPEKVVDYSFFSNYIGGGMSAVIFQEIREARSLAYAAWGGYGFAGYRGDENEVYGGLGCQADKTLEAATLLHQLMRSPPFDEKRFRETAKAIEENYRSNPIPFRAVPSTLMAWEDQGITGGDPRPKRFEKALKYRLEDLKAFAQRFQNKPMTFYILGHKERLPLEGIKKLGDFEEKTLEQIFPY